ncbi:hypothetical protein [Nitrososphaera sp.]|uniref:hypothetical protein n=1 Tax=Nitrososphaera sp. TaxID=1971748 RepID=UPI00307E7C14
MSKCAACGRDAPEKKKYCRHHEQALGRLQEHYSVWVRAYGSGDNISWQDYLRRLSDMTQEQQAGEWVKEVIRAEMKKEKESV